MKTLAGFALLAAVVLVAVPAVAGDAGEQTTVKGWITDSFCGKNNANAEGKACILACAKKGADLVLYADGKTYKISDQKAALENVGREVAITGTVEKDTIKVSRIEAVGKKKA